MAVGLTGNSSTVTVKVKKHVLNMLGKSEGLPPSNSSSMMIACTNEKIKRYFRKVYGVLASQERQT